MLSTTLIDGGERKGFTLIELCVVLVTVALLALMLLPALASTRPNTQVAQCMNNLRQLSITWIMYAGDNSDKAVSNPGWVNGLMDWTASSNNTNTTLLLSGAFGKYIQSAAVFKCPADNYQSTNNPGPRVRSVAMNLALGSSSGPTAQGNNPNNRVYYGVSSGGAQSVGRGLRKTTELLFPGPAQTFLIMDEHPDSINDASLAHNPGHPSSGEYWRDLPAGYHNGAAGVSFTDGHSEIHKWRNKVYLDGGVATLWPVLKVDYGGSGIAPWGSHKLSNDPDYEWVQDRMPYRK